MGYLNETGLTELWGKIKATFGLSLSVSNATVSLKNGAATPVTLSEVTIPDATTSTPGVMTASDKSKLDGIAAGATAVTSATVSGWGYTKNTGTYSKPSGGIPKTDLASTVQTSLGKADTALQSHQSLAAYATLASPTFTGTPSAPTAVAGTNTTQVATTAFVTSAISTAVAGNASFQGVLNNGTMGSFPPSSYKKGWYWVSAINTDSNVAGVGKIEPGDMIFCIVDSDSPSAGSLNNFTVVQANITAMTTAEVDAICV